jgi:hypothetical protein
MKFISLESVNFVFQLWEFPIVLGALTDKLADKAEV